VGVQCRLYQKTNGYFSRFINGKAIVVMVRNYLTLQDLM